MKKLCFVLLCLLVCLALSACGDDLLEATKEFYINDSANVLSYETKAIVYYNSERLEQQSGAQIVVATVRNLNEMTIQDYSTKLFNQWGVGDSKKNNGFMLLMQIASDPNEGDYYIVVGDGAQPILSNSEANDLLYKELEPYFAKGQYDLGVQNVYRELYERVSKFSNVTAEFWNGEALIRNGKVDRNTLYGAQDENFGRSEEPGSDFPTALIVIIILVIVFIAFSTFSDHSSGGTGISFYPGYYTRRRRRSVLPPPPAPGAPPPPSRHYHSPTISTRTYRSAPPRPSFGSSAPRRSSGFFGGLSSGSSSSSRSSYSPSRSSSSPSRSSSSSSRSSGFGRASGGGGHSTGGGAGRRR